jgi:hypothetical protein
VSNIDTVRYFDLTSDEYVNDGLLWSERGRPWYVFKAPFTADELEAGEGPLLLPCGPGVTAPAGCGVDSSDGYEFIGDVDEVVVIQGQRMARITLT